MDKQYSHKTVEGYRTAIAGSIKPIAGKDLAQDPFISNLLKSFKRERPRSIQEFPPWDLSLVLFSLIKEPFEPLSEAPLKSVTFMTVSSLYSLQVSEETSFMLSATRNSLMLPIG